MFGGVFCGRLLDAGHLRVQLFAGIALQFTGTALASFATKYWQILFAQGFCVGMGSSFLWLPSVVVIAQYFDTKIMIATGIAATGSSAGKTSLIFSLSAAFNIYPARTAQNADLNRVQNSWRHLPDLGSQVNRKGRLSLGHTSHGICCASHECRLLSSDAASNSTAYKRKVLRPLYVSGSTLCHVCSLYDSLHSTLD